MIKDIVDIFTEWSLKHKAVKVFKYQKRIMINQQNNNGYIQVILETDPYFQWMRTNNLETVTLNMEVLAFVTDDYTVVQAQDDCINVGAQILAKISSIQDYMGFLKIYDYSIIGLENFTTDNCSGARFSVELIVPDPVNVCTLDDMFNDEIPETEEKDNIDLIDVNPPSQINDLILTPIKLPRKDNECKY